MAGSPHAKDEVDDAMQVDDGFDDRTMQLALAEHIKDEPAYLTKVFESLNYQFDCDDDLVELSMLLAAGHPVRAIELEIELFKIFDDDCAFKLVGANQLMNDTYYLIR